MWQPGSHVIGALARSSRQSSVNSRIPRAVLRKRDLYKKLKKPLVKDLCLNQMGGVLRPLKGLVGSYFGPIQSLGGRGTVYRECYPESPLWLN